MKTKTYTVYKFKELSPETQDKIIENYRDINVDYEWWQDETLLNIPEATWKCIYFDLDRGSYLQFEDLKISRSEEFRKVLNLPKKLWDMIDYSFYSSRNNNTEIEFDGEGLSKSDQETLHTSVEKFSDVVHEALSNLRKQYDYLTSREAIIETLEANDYDFNLDGRIDR